ncbi:hypothetical protein NPIL_551221 [Nephila pilipes]|uniref:Peptidase aspartic putative domain-containing protein n=1 Tax=Nephila pilipes TaxID=299642 RepID=A0A8X6K791_NEPPI|nr:hypothetical protein NPIL_551221 [Nephila pilipes]
MLNDVVGNSELANNSFLKQVFLQTVIFCINVNAFEYNVRILLDSGPEKAYISKFMAVALKLKVLGEETVVYGLFGGIQRKEANTQKISVNMNNIDKRFSCKLDAN